MTLLRGLVTVTTRRLPRPPHPAPILSLRAAFVASVALVAALLVVLAAVLPLVTGRPTRPATQGASILALVGPAGAWLARQRRLPCAPPWELVDRYVTTVLLGAAAAETAALLGLVTALLQGALWPYLGGVTLYAVGLAAVAPTSADVERREARLTVAGCPRSLREALYRPGG